MKLSSQEDSFNWFVFSNQDSGTLSVICTRFPGYAKPGMVGVRERCCLTFLIFLIALPCFFVGYCIYRGACAYCCVAVYTCFFLYILYNIIWN